ncbi:hypothetical protein GQ457_16G029940 [Hibiscus cannabinus]
MATSSSLQDPPASIFSSSSIKAPVSLGKPYPILVNIKRHHPQRKSNFVLDQQLKKYLFLTPRQCCYAAKELETVAGPVETDLGKLQRKWKLIYSSEFSSRTLGESHPGLPTGRLLPVTLGQVKHILIFVFRCLTESMW